MPPIKGALTGKNCQINPSANKSLLTEGALLNAANSQANPLNEIPWSEIRREGEPLREMKRA